MRGSGDSVSAVLEVSHKIYERTLVIYPSELRRDFGTEMIEVFDQQLSEAFSRSGFPGVLRVWYTATREFITVALPGRLIGRLVPIVGVMATLALMMWCVGYIGYVMETACAGCSH